MKVGMKLGLGFGLVLVLLGTLLAVGILRLTDIKHDVDVVVDELWPKTQLLQDGLGVMPHKIFNTRSHQSIRSDGLRFRPLGSVAQGK
ncbi:MAG: hypothetical protein OSW71_08850, partial [Proteobacteria bacterium]|nr:hypothetical protein [Pseudomonadota bacterium]